MVLLRPCCGCLLALAAAWNFGRSVVRCAKNGRARDRCVDEAAFGPSFEPKFGAAACWPDGHGKRAVGGRDGRDWSCACSVSATFFSFRVSLGNFMWARSAVVRALPRSLGSGSTRVPTSLEALIDPPAAERRPVSNPRMARTLVVALALATGSALVAPIARTATPQRQTVVRRACGVVRHKLGFRSRPAGAPRRRRGQRARARPTVAEDDIVNRLRSKTAAPRAPAGVRKRAAARPRGAGER